MAKSRHAEEMIVVQTKLPESVVRYIDKKALKEFLSRSDYIRRWVLIGYKSDKESTS